MQIACFLLPRFALALECRDRPELGSQPVIVGAAPNDPPLVLDCSSEAEREGVRPGMPIRQALACCRTATLLQARPAFYQQAADLLAEALERVSPLVEPAEPGCVYLGLDGLRRLYADESAILQAGLLAIHEALGILAQAGSAGGKFPARMAALAAPPGGLFAGDERLSAFLATISVRQLPVSPNMRARLWQLGIRTLGDLAALPFGPLQAQFGAEGALAWRLARGDDSSPLLPRGRLPELTDELEFSTPTTSVIALLHAAGRLLERLLRRPEVQGRVVRGLSVCVYLEDGRTWQRTFSLHTPSADPQYLLLLLRGQLGGLHLPALTSGLALTLLQPAGEVGHQANLFAQPQWQRQHLDEAVHQLTLRLGHVPIARIMEVEPWSRIPERRYALVDYAPSTSPARSGSS